MPWMPRSCQFAQRLPFEPWQRPDAPALAIRAGARHIAALNKLFTQTKNQLHAAQLTAMTPGFVIASLQQTIAYLEAQIEHLRRQVRDIIAVDEQPQHIFDLLVNATDIAAAKCHSAPRRTPGLA